MIRHVVLFVGSPVSSFQPCIPSPEGHPLGMKKRSSIHVNTLISPPAARTGCTPPRPERRRVPRPKDPIPWDFSLPNRDKMCPNIYRSICCSRSSSSSSSISRSAWRARNGIGSGGVGVAEPPKARRKPPGSSGSIALLFCLPQSPISFDLLTSSYNLHH